MGCKHPARHRHEHCCEECRGGRCDVHECRHQGGGKELQAVIARECAEMRRQCSRDCNEALAARMSKCVVGVQGCKKPANNHHFHCCQKCPGGECDRPEGEAAA